MKNFHDLLQRHESLQEMSIVSWDCGVIFQN